MIIKSLYLSKNVNDVSKLVLAQPSTALFMKVFLEFDVENMLYYLSFDRKSVAAILDSEEAVNRKSLYPLIFMSKHNHTGIDTSLKLNQIRSTQKMMEYVILKQNKECYAHLFQHNMIDIMLRGIPVVDLFNSNIFNYTFSYVEWPNLSLNDDKVFTHYNGSWIKLRYEFKNIFPGQHEEPFLMSVEDVFSITGRGTVATGRIERGVVKVGEEIEIVGLGESKKTICTGVEMFRKELGQGQAGDNVGILVRGIEKDEIQRGHVLAKPGSIKPHTKAKAQIYVLNKEEGGRHTPFFKGYRPQFFFGTADVTGIVELPDGVEMVMPGDNLAVNIELQKAIAMEPGQRFAIREGGKTIGAGNISEIA